MNNKNINIIILAMGILLLTVIAYSNHFNNGFHFDDSHTVIDNVHIRQLSNIPTFFTDPSMFSSDPDHHSMRPLVTTSLAIDYWLADGLNPFYFQLSTFLWHIVLGLMLFFMYKKLFNLSITHNRVSLFALFATGWFILHTANAETINYVISRSDVQSTALIVASFLLYISYPNLRKWYLYVVPALIGVFAKETVIVLIILLFFYIILFEKKLSLPDLFKRDGFNQIWTVIKMLLPIIAAVIVAQFYTITTSQITSDNNTPNPYLYYWLTQFYVWFHYFTSFFLPLNLSADSDWVVITNVLDARILVGLIFVTLLVLSIIKLSKNNATKPISFGLIWFIASLLPTSVIPLAEVTNDHRMYFAFVGLSLSVVASILYLLLKTEKQIRLSTAKKASIAFGALLILSLNAYGVYQRNKVWKDDETLWFDVTVKSPLNGRGLMNYGLTQMEKGDYDRAIIYFEKAKPFVPNYNSLYINLAIAKGAIGKHQEAMNNFEKAISLKPNYFGGYAFYARYLSRNRKYNEAKIMAEKSLAINPNSLMTLNVLMDVYQNLGLWSDLDRTANHTLKLLPNDKNAQGYLVAAKEKKSPIEIAFSAKDRDDLTAADYLNMSLAYYTAGKYEKCIEACESALKLKPDYADAYSNIGASYNMLKQWERGKNACLEALKIDPNHKLAQGNLAWALKEIK